MNGFYDLESKFTMDIFNAQSMEELYTISSKYSAIFEKYNKIMNGLFKKEKEKYKTHYDSLKLKIVKYMEMQEFALQKGFS